MKTMPRLMTWAMRFVIEAMLTRIQLWEDKHANPADYRMRYLTTGLWQASQSLRQIRNGEFNPMQHQAAWMMPESAVLGKRYVAEVLGDAPIPLRTYEN